MTKKLALLNAIQNHTSETLTNALELLSVLEDLDTLSEIADGFFARYQKDPIPENKDYLAAWAEITHLREALVEKGFFVALHNARYSDSDTFTCTKVEIEVTTSGVNDTIKELNRKIQTIHLQLSAIDESA